MDRLVDLSNFKCVSQGIFKIDEKNLTISKVLGTTFSLLFPLVFLVFDQGYNGAYKYFLLGCTFEAAALYFAVLIMFLFGTGIDGKRSFDSLGIAFVLVFLVIMSAFFLPYALINIDYYHYSTLNWYDVILAFSGLLFLGYNWIRDIVNLRNLSIQGLFKEEDENPLISVGMIVLWILGLNLVYVFTSL